jgi:IS30 family transposase
MEYYTHLTYDDRVRVSEMKKNGFGIRQMARALRRNEAPPGIYWLIVKEALKGLQTFFCDPYSPWQKGRVENSNGRLRKDFPRKIDLQKLTDDDFNESIENYNLTPRKGLKWFAPDEVFQKNINRVALQT